MTARSKQRTDKSGSCILLLFICASRELLDSEGWPRGANQSGSHVTAGERDFPTGITVTGRAGGAGSAPASAGGAGPQDRAAVSP